MPTGYTASIKDGITFKQFALNCARNFGALIDMRDKPMSDEIPEKFEGTNYYLENLTNSKEKLAIILALSDEECEEKAVEEFTKEQERRAKITRKEIELRAQYKDMLKQVRNWHPPSVDHNGLKKFMESQILESIKFDCSLMSHYEDDPVIKLTDNEWRNEEIKSTAKNIEYYVKEHDKEVERNDSKNKWVSRLRNSLE